MQPPNPSIEKLMKLSILGQTDEPQNPLQQGINKTGAGFQLPQIAPQVPQGQLLPQIPQAPQTLSPDAEVQFDFSSAIEKPPEELGVTEFTRPTSDHPMISSTPDQGLKEFQRGGETFFVNPAGRRQLSGVNPPSSIPSQAAQAQAPIAPTAPTQGLTTVGGQPLGEFLAGGQQLDPQGRMIDPSVDRSFFEEQSAAREQRAAEQFGVARGPDAMDREAGEMSTADARDLANLKNPRATEGERARAMQVAERLGRDPITGAPIRTAQEGMTPEQQVARERLELDRAKFADEVISREGPSKELTPAQKEFAKKSGEGAYDWDQGGRASAKENIDKFDGVINDLKTGQLDTRTLVEFAPLVGDWARAAVNPTGQQGLDTIRGVIFQGLRDTLGAQFTEREGERLVKAAYNPQLDEASNVARLEPALERMRATFDAKEALTKHIIGGGSVKDYKGQTPREVYDSFDGGAGGSPIQGDVDVASDADAILAAQ